MKLDHPIKIGLICLVLVALPYSGFSYLMDVNPARGYFVETAVGPIGIGDRTESSEPTGVVCVSPGRTRIVSYVYLGYAVDFHLPGRATLWLWIGPMLVIGPLLILSFLRRIWKQKREIIKVILYAIFGFYYGVILVFFSGLSGSMWEAWADMTCSPLGYIDFRLGWCFWPLIGTLLALQFQRWAVWSLLISVILHYVAICGYFIYFGPQGWQSITDSVSSLKNNLAWPICWALIYIVGQCVIWIVLIKNIRRLSQKDNV